MSQTDQDIIRRDSLALRKHHEAEIEVQDQIIAYCIEKMDRAKHEKAEAENRKATAKWELYKAQVSA